MSAILSSELVNQILPREIDLSLWDNEGIVLFAQKKVLKRLEDLLSETFGWIKASTDYCLQLNWDPAVAERESYFNESLLSDHPAVSTQLSDWIDRTVYKILCHVESDCPDLPCEIKDEILFLQKRIASVG